MKRPTLTLLAAVTILFAAAPAFAGPPAWDELPPKDRDIWQRLIGLEAGIAAMHCVQPIQAAAGEIDWKPKHAVAIAGCALYGGNTLLLLYRQKLGLWINIIGPAVGLTTITTGWILNEAGAIDAEIRPDVPQIVGGTLQLWAWIESLNLLLRYHRRGEPLLRHVQLSPTPGGVVFTVRW